MKRPLLAASVVLLGCTGGQGDGSATFAGGATTRTIEVRVTLDGEPAADTVVMQGGAVGMQRTDDQGGATVPLEVVEGETWMVASHPQARITAAAIPDEGSGPVDIALTRYLPDSPDYVFRDPGVPGDPGSTAQCNHCHFTMHADWAASPHRTSASNPHVQDLYAGTASLDEPGCADAGGAWMTGPLPGGGEGERCYLGAGVLPDLNGCVGPCADATAFAGCADCHAPGIDGVLGGRDLREADGHAYEYGVHCDVCHRIESVDLESAQPGVGGRLRLHRPSEGPAFGFDNHPLVFGVHHDAASPVMGLVQRDVFATADLCSGCHENHQPVLSGAIDLQRWPSGLLPVDTTYSEWRDGPLGDSTHCQGCHMPPAGGVTNGGDLQDLSLPPGLVVGWKRPPGAVRHHSFLGPRQPWARMLQLAATVQVDKQVDGGTLTATVTTRNAGPAHAIPGGEALRSMILTVAARCGDEALVATGGDAVPAFGGSFAAQSDFAAWPGAQVGDVVRVVRRDGWRDYAGWGPFGDGTFDAPAKNLPRDSVVGQATVVGVDGASVTFDPPLPDGDFAFRGDDTRLAGSAGFAFARVLVDGDGARVPHFAAVDVASDNRLLPQQSVTTVHEFASPCADPTVEATLLYRPLPLALAAAKNWPTQDAVMAREVR